MRTISDNLKTIMKSRAMIGDNRPTAQLIIDGQAPKTNKWGNMWYMRSTGVNHYDAIWDGGHIAKTADGRLIGCYGKADNVYLSYCDTEDELFTQHNAFAAKEWIFMTKAGLSPLCRLLKRKDGKLLLFIARLGTAAEPGMWVKTYISNTGNGDDFIEYGTIYNDSTVTKSESGGVGVGLPLLLNDGTIVVPMDVVDYSWLNTPVQQPYLARSTDGGKTWTYKNISSGSIYDDSTKSIAAIGSELVAMKQRNYNGYTCQIWKSTDKGATWSHVETMPQSTTTENIGNWVFNDLSVDDPNQPDGFHYFGKYNTYNTAVIYTLYRRPKSAGNLPASSGWTYGTATDPTKGGTATWEFVRELDPLGDDGQDIGFFLESGTAAFLAPNSYSTGKAIKMLGYIAYQKTLEIKSVRVSRSNTVPSCSAAIVLDNKGGKLSPDNANSEWHKVFLPNTKITIKLGYGAEVVTVFTGYIDKTTPATFPQELILDCRDLLKLALDQTITKITYSNMDIGDIFTNLAIRSGMGSRSVEKANVTVSSKEFTWESYGDAMDWCAEFVGFEYFVDEDGKLIFRYPKEPKDANGNPIISYTFREGEDIINLGYEIDDEEQFRKIIVVGETSDGTAISSTFNHTNPDFLKLPANKILKVDVSEPTTQTNLDKVAARLGQHMINRMRRVKFEVIGNPFLQIGDAIQVIETSTTISEAYRILEIESGMDSDGFKSVITAYHYAYVPLN